MNDPTGRILHATGEYHHTRDRAPTMARGSTGNWRAKVVEACGTVYSAAYGNAALASGVQLMLGDTEYRTDVMADAMKRVSPTGDPDGYKRLQSALDKLRGYEGRTI